MANCPRCNKRSAKRFCPALDTTICTVCCARDRMLEIRCPESCQYLISGRENAVAREKELRSKESERVVKPAPPLTRRELEFVYVIEWNIVKTQREAYQNIEDHQLLAAVQNAVKNLETEDSGIIYEHREFSTVIDDVSRRIRSSFDETDKDIPAEARPRRSEMIHALEYIGRNIQSHSDRGDARSYIRFAAQFYPWEQPEDKIVIPTS